MTTYSLSNINLLKIISDDNSTECYGCNQDWYQTERQRDAGCGPTVACNILLYLTKLHLKGEQEEKDCCREEAIRLMEEAWINLTPSENGIATTKIFCDHIKRYLRRNNFNTQCNSIDVPAEAISRPSLEKLVCFIVEALEKDVPIAFLNLCNGEVCNLNKWHWVTIVDLKHSGNEILINIIDGGQILEIDLALWYSTTTKGGGMVYIVGEEK